VTTQPSRESLVYLHKAWIGYVQPQGLVVTAAVLAEADIFPPLDLLEIQERFAEFARTAKHLPSFQAFARDFLEWPDDLAVWADAVSPQLAASVDGEALSPSFAVLDPDTGAPLVLGLSVDPSRDLDARGGKGPRTALSPHQTLEKLLWETGVSMGIVENGRAVRLVFAPRGESVGFATFLVEDMVRPAGRPMLGALLMLLSARRLSQGDPDKRLAALLLQSREYQSTVSAALREQVLVALGALLRGFEEADARAGHALLTRGLRNEDLREVYAGLVTVIMRLVFLLYAEEKGLLPLHDPLYAQGYSLRGLFDRLEADREAHGATMQHRRGAWARLVSLFRLLHGGVHAASGLSLPARRGDLFDPDRYPFLEGRESVRQSGEIIELPLISDATVLEVLSSLALHNRERLMYRGLDVEHIGGVYEGLMGFDILLTDGKSACLLPHHVVVNLDDLARKPGSERLRYLKAEAGVDVKDKAAAEVRDARDAEGLFGALARRISPRRPGLLPAGTLVLQPGQERRRTGSHYTPRALTRPIVESALRPVWERLGPEATPEQLLDLKICDPAMGSGAFLVEACRQVADKLTGTWRRTGTTPTVPADEDALLHARRLVAQRCLYGVDKNRLAVDLARVSLWLETFAADHPFTFVDHALRCGDSLVGFSRDQISDFAFRARPPAAAAAELRQAVEPHLRKAEKTRKKAVLAQVTQLILVRQMIDERVTRAEKKRRALQSTGDVVDDRPLAELWKEADEALEPVHTIADVLVSAFFSETTEKARTKARDDWAFKVQAWLSESDGGEFASDINGAAEGLRLGEHALSPFHWEIEFPEVFARDNPGFDAIVGNPPFAGKNSIAAANAATYPDWLLFAHDESHGNADLVAHFFRRAFELLRHGGAFGLIATNTIAQGDTRSTGLRWICTHGGSVYEARRRRKWPGMAAVMVSVVHVLKGKTDRAMLDGGEVPQITAFLFHGGGSEDSRALRRNADLSFVGSYVLGMGFTFDDTNENATSIATMRRLIENDPKNQKRIFPYLGGEELNTSPTHAHHRYVINFAQMSEEQAREWPDLMAIVEARVKPERLKQNREMRARYWWRFGEATPALFEALDGKKRVLGRSLTSKHACFTFITDIGVIDQTIIVFAIESASMLSVLSSQCHEMWSRFFGATMKDDPRYNVGDCFETFPFPPPGDPRTLARAHPALEVIGQRYYDFRAALMVRNNAGLTKTYNRFHDPEETKKTSPDIATLRALHAEMDRAVLDAYGWTDIVPTYDFRLQLDDSTRYTWDDATRDEVLARLLDLNRRYAAEESAAAEAAAAEAAWQKATSRDNPPPPTDAAPAPAKKGARKKAPPGSPGNQGTLFH